MPLLSVIVPVHAVQGFLRPCLDSILNQSFTDLELIAIDDASPDHCPAILDEYDARDPRVHVIHLAQPIGPGPARNLALERASGTYVWFVDSDDWIAEGSLAAIATKLRDGEPDVLMLNHDTVDWLGKVKRNAWRNVLARLDEEGTFPLAREPRLLEMFTVSWNKIVRRELLLRTGIRLESGWYEDIPYTYGVLVAAERIAALGRVSYHYRRRRQDAITQTLSAQHFDVFRQWTRVFARLDALGERADPFRGAIFDRMLWHMFVVQSLEQRLPPHTRRAYFSQMSQAYHRFAPSAAIPQLGRKQLGRLHQVRRRLVARNAYRTFRALRRTRLTVYKTRSLWRRSARRVRRSARATKRLLSQGLGRAYYAIQRRLPLDRQLAVYAAYWYRGYACNPAAIYEKARELAPDVRGVWVVDKAKAAAIPPGVPYVTAGSFGYYKALARGRWLINNVNFPDFVVKRAGSVHLQTHHGTPVKVMGLDQGKFPIGLNGMSLTRLMRRCDRWDYSISANPHSTEAWTRSYPCRYQTLETGYPRNDRLALADAITTARVRAELEIPPGVTTVLYAPTHREYDSGFSPLVDVAAFAEALGPDYLILQRAHYFYSRAAAPNHAKVWDVSRHNPIEDLLIAADVLITDYSSVMFDYAVLDRPIVLYTPDWDTYQRVRGVTFDLLATPPGVVAMSQADLVDAFRTGALDDDAATKARAQFRARFCALEDGHAAERVVRQVFQR